MSEAPSFSHSHTIHTITNSCGCDLPVNMLPVNGHILKTDNIKLAKLRQKVSRIQLFFSLMENGYFLLCYFTLIH